MTNAVYPEWKEDIMQALATRSLASTNVRTAFLDTGVYTYNVAHEFYSSLAGGVNPGTRAGGQALAGRTYANGTFDANDSVFLAFTGGASLEGITIYIDDGSSDATSPLFLYLDSSITGMPFTPSGADVTVQWDAAGIVTI
jgi:hypothetical protein